MDPLHTIRRRVVILTAGFLALLLVLWLLTPYKKMVAGAGLGLLVSLYNVLYMARKVRLAGETTLATGSTRHRGTGMINRYLMVALAILVAFKYPMHFDVLLYTHHCIGVLGGSKTPNHVRKGVKLDTWKKHQS
jgi:ATP synthase protein I